MSDPDFLFLNKLAVCALVVFLLLWPWGVHRPWDGQGPGTRGDQ